MRIDLRKFFEAYEGTPHQLAAIDQLADAIPNELLDKFSDWVVCFEVDGEVSEGKQAAPSTTYYAKTNIIGGTAHAAGTTFVAPARAEDAFVEADNDDVIPVLAVFKLIAVSLVSKSVCNPLIWAMLKLFESISVGIDCKILLVALMVLFVKVTASSAPIFVAS